MHVVAVNNTYFHFLETIKMRGIFLLSLSRSRSLSIRQMHSTLVEIIRIASRGQDAQCARTHTQAHAKSFVNSIQIQNLLAAGYLV